ncbi:MAG: tetratricopeptide repeat protein [Oscillospiraceae bacterium]
MSGTAWVILILFFNLIAAVLYFLYSFFIRRQRVKGFLISLMMLLCPLVGGLFLGLSSLLYVFYFSKQADLNEISFNKERVQVITPPDEATDLNTVPLEEALLVSDKGSMRRSLLNVLKSDFDNSLAAISAALESEDTETSHYAATVLMDVTAKFIKTTQSMQVEYDKQPDNTELASMYADYIFQFLETGILSEIEVKTYSHLYVQLVGSLYTHGRQKVEGRDYRRAVSLLMDQKESDEALMWAKRAVENLPQNLDAHLALLKVYHETGQRERFLEALEALKASDIILNKEAIDLVRFYAAAGPA